MFFGLDACFLIVIIIEDTSRVSNIYTKQTVQITEDYFINQFPCLGYFVIFLIYDSYFNKKCLKTIVYTHVSAWLYAIQKY